MADEGQAIPQTQLYAEGTVSYPPEAGIADQHFVMRSSNHPDNGKPDRGGAPDSGVPAEASGAYPWSVPHLQFNDEAQRMATAERTPGAMSAGAMSASGATAAATGGSGTGTPLPADPFAAAGTSEQPRSDQPPSEQPPSEQDVVVP